MRNSATTAWLICLCVSLTVIWGKATHGDEQDDTYELMRLFVDTFEEIDENYVKDIDRRDLIEAAVQGMLAKLDPYSNYISPDDLSAFEQDVHQEFGGIGIQVHFDQDHREIVVMTPLPGTPAYKAGVRAGDRIISIEGQTVAEFEVGKELATAVKLLKGPAGKKVTITVRHETADDDGTAEEIAENTEELPEDQKAEVKSTIEKLEIERDVIKVATVMGDRYNPDGTWNFMLDDASKIGYIRLSHFSRNSTSELLAALKQLEKEGMKGLVLDLRWNPGGLLTSATEISDLFVESGKIVSTKGRNTQERTWRAKKRGTFSDFPMAILINRFSASASEIVSACLQDHDRAVIVGERSWGKGSVQNVIELEDGNSALKLTTASYHRPSGKNIHRFPKAKPEDEWGVMPDEGEKVEFTTKQMIEYRKFRSERDVLSNEAPPESEFVDTQLDKALEYVKSAMSGEVKKQEAKEETEQVEPEEESKKAAFIPRSFFVVPAQTVL
ncbi:MAG TPA: S41 family peptidase [Planctomycetaceae bacterium]|nr:S41 family peptidase [Planctomycetaceae bacterium]